MLQWQQRVIDEKRGLDVKIEALDRFLKSHEFKSVDADERARLDHQRYLMDLYSDILKKRIAAFK